MLPSLTRRQREPEVMDKPELDSAAHIDALQALERINYLSASARILWRPIRQLAAALGRPVAILDVACGAGDVPLRLWHKARSAGVPVKIAGCDISDRAVQHARERANAQQAGVDFFQLNALADDLPAGYDVLTCSLFLHHLDDSEALLLLSKLRAAAGRLVLVSDLGRSRTGWLLAWLVTRCVTRSWVARIDGPLSVRAAFTANELRGMAVSAGLADAAVERRWPCRLLLRWAKPLTVESTP